MTTEAHFPQLAKSVMLKALGTRHMRLISSELPARTRPKNNLPSITFGGIAPALTAKNQLDDH